MKQNVFFTALVAMVMTLFALTGCNSDGDETISLEYGNVKKMIVGQWVVTGGSASGGSSRVLTFTDDGYYTDSSDGGKKRHSWRLSGSSSDDEPYYGGIYLDGQYYDITSMSDGNWVLTDKNGNTLELGRDGGGGSSQGSQNPSGSVNAAYLVGSWRLIHQTYCDDGTVRDLGSRDYIITFTADGYCSVTDRRLFEDEIHGTESYKVSGNFLIIDNSKTSKYRIDKLTESEMILQWYDEDGETKERSTFQKVANNQSSSGSGSQGSQEPSGGISGSINMDYLVGSWKLIHQTYCDDGTVRDLGSRDYIITFTTDGYCSVTDKSLFEDEIHGTERYKVSGNFLIIDDSKTSKFRIDKLTKSEMILQWYDEDGETKERSTFQKVVDDQSSFGGGGSSTSETSYTTCPDSKHPHAIDLGLPSGTKWACCNVGANAPDNYGGYFAWGETSEKDVYTWETYLYGNSGTDMVNIGLDIASTKFDVANAKWGSLWCMPTLEQCWELIEKTKSEWGALNGVEGRFFISKKNGNSVFLPAAGKRSYSHLYEKADMGYYWLSTINSVEPYDPCFLSIHSDYAAKGVYNYGRYVGQTVRPVRKN